MTKRLLPFLLWLLMFVPAAAATAATAAAAEPPDRLIERLSNEILERIRTDAALKAGDRKKLDELVDNTVMPHVDFRR
ncbi:MAG: ABC transporter substrate-binding protein, partial [Burkholderiales bacterium]|nr:ABC transporter substrate-binding protein [Burkholderiales bacterium]